ncbi:ABC transporter permease [Bosea sp. BIWAKO-01]|uniref:ABC transporter permease n=1 Tax=Bosea sp. BIWAKO-01 TaxID=506668 RepID=UPI000853CEAA|nr:ABC transporter permease [Bosea sp. BIWAKO-01]GAU85274.1 ABC opine/polyamine transporterinner membrane subunit [Bosea sp. BIWAKO-01]
MDERPISPALKILAGAMFIFLLAPLIVVVPISFSGDSYMMFPPSSWSTKWYPAIFADGKMVSAFWTSLALAFVVTVLSLLIGLPAAYALVRLKPRGAEFLSSLFTAPLLLPTIVLGLAILIVFSGYGLLATFQGLVAAHLVVTLPYAIRVLSTALATLPIPVEEAAATLGASPLTVFRRVTLPMMRSGIVGTTALCFLVSFDEVVLSLFMTGPRISTLPVAMYHRVEQQADPLVAALSVLLVVLTLVVVLVVDRTSGLAKTFVK